MKLKMLLFSAAAGLSYLSLSSYSAGPSSSAGHVAVSGCGTATTCHGAKNTATVAAIVVKDGTTTITNNKYTPGKKYTIIISGTNSSKTKFGYQFSATKGASSTGAISNVPSGSKIATAGGVSVAEQSGVITAAFGLSITLDWTAPAAGTGAVTLSASVNAVDGTGSTSNDQFNTIQMTLSENTTDIETIIADNSFILYPNPATDILNIEKNTAKDCTGILFNGYGQKVMDIKLTQQYSSVNISELPKGVYYLKTGNGGTPKTIPFIKE